MRWPAEWEPHTATWLSWPRNPDTWPKNLRAAQQEFAAFIRAVAEVETVNLLCGGDAMQSARAAVGGIRNVELIDIQTNDAWIRDYGPTFVNRDNKQVVVDWTYNAWGGKYPPFDQDAKIAEKIATRLNCAAIKVDRVIEGGALEGNGAGLVMTTESCLLNENRSGKSAKAQIESILKQRLGANEILWLSGGDIAGDDTDGHIDQIARFVSEKTIVVCVEKNRDDVNFETFQLASRELKQFNAVHGNQFEIVDLPMPGPVMFDGVRLPAGYANFYLANGIVIVPQFDDPADEIAVSLLKSVFPDRQAIALPSRNLSVGLGSFHCLSQQQPAQP